VRLASGSRKGINPEERQRLAGTLQRVTLDWQRLSRYAFWTALACVIIAIGSLFSDSELMARIIEFFAFSSLARIGLPALVAVLFYLWGSAVSGEKRSGTTALKRSCSSAYSLRRLLSGSLVNGSITAAATLPRCSWRAAPFMVWWAFWAFRVSVAVLFTLAR
jgi:hypothetical protein